jgi:hypothetical protein
MLVTLMIIKADGLIGGFSKKKKTSMTSQSVNQWIEDRTSDAKVERVEHHLP